MRFKMLKIVTALVIVGVVLLSICVTLLRIHVFPAPPGGEGHSSSQALHFACTQEVSFGNRS